MARALSKTTAAIHSSFGFKAYNSIANLQRGRPVRDDDDGTAEISHAAQHFSLGLGVEGRCAFIEQEHGGLEWTARATARCCSRSSYQLSLVSSQVRSIWHHLPSIFTAFQV